MPVFDFVLAQPAREHGELMFNWRNDPITRANSFHKELKKWEPFYQEYLSKYFRFPDLPPLFATMGGEKVAFLHFEPCEDFATEGMGQQRKSCCLSINVGPDFRGRGIGTSLLKAIQPWIKNQGYEALYGEVKVDNQISQKAFLHAGFRQLTETSKLIDFKEDVKIVRFVVEFTPIGKIPSKVFVIAEAGSNWRMGSYKRDLAMAKILISIAVEAQADAVKFQVFKPETIYAPNAGSLGSLEEHNIKDSMEDLFADLALPYEMLAVLHEECIRNHIEFMATPFSSPDFEAIDPFVQRHKIASYELNHPHLLALAAQSGKPLILSTGASTEEEIEWAVNTYHQLGGRDLTLLQCTAAYPAPPSSMNLRALTWMRKRFQAPVGLSDHSHGAICAAVSAVALGATVIEKHFTLNKCLPGPDHSFALEPSELKDMVDTIREAEQMKGGYIKVVDDAEKELRTFARRGVQATKSIKTGELFKEGVNLDILRPGKQLLGLHPQFITEIEGNKATREIGLGQGIQFGDFGDFL